jgi:hypothetical protein
MVARLVRENGELRQEMEHVRKVVTQLTNQQAATAQTLRGLASYVTAVNDDVLRQSRRTTSSE